MRHSSTYLIRYLIILLPILFACERKEIPALITTEVTDITDNSALSGGQVLSDGGSPITSSGICWTSSGNPTITDSKTTDTPTDDSFTSYMEDLEPGTSYSVRAYATNNEGTGYGNPVYFTTWPRIPFVSDATVSSVTAESAVVEGHFIFGDGLIVFLTGICYGLSPNVGFTNSFVNTTIASDSIKINLKGLQSNTVYYVQLCVIVRLFGTSNYYAILGPETSFKTDALPVIPVLPLVTTGTVSSVTNTTAEIDGEVLSDGDAPILKRGICVSINESPTIMDTVFSSEGGVGKFNIKLVNLNPTTKYYARAFATNSVGTVYGLQVNFKTYTDSIQDITGNVYTTMQIGTQQWMRENLRVTKLNDGTGIPEVTDVTWLDLDTIGYCWYDNTDDTISGALYNWYVVNTNRLCPSGWHVPSFDEWNILFQFLGGLYTDITYLKLFDKEVGFLASFEGYRSLFDGVYENRNSVGSWWTSTEDADDKHYAYSFSLTLGGYQSLTIEVKRYGFSVRCIKD